MYLAGCMGNLEMTKGFLKSNANPNVLDPEGNTPLHFACVEGHTSVVQCLKPTRTLETTKVLLMEMSPLKLKLLINLPVLNLLS